MFIPQSLENIHIHKHKGVLLEGHSYITNAMKAHFDGQHALQSRPMTVTIKDQLRKATEMKAWLEDGNSEGTRRDPSKGHGVKRRNILYDLPYWKVP